MCSGVSTCSLARDLWSHRRQIEMNTRPSIWLIRKSPWKFMLILGRWDSADCRPHRFFFGKLTSFRSGDFWNPFRSNTPALNEIFSIIAENFGCRFKMDHLKFSVERCFSEIRPCDVSRVRAKRNPSFIIHSAPRYLQLLSISLPSLSCFT